MAGKTTESEIAVDESTDVDTDTEISEAQVNEVDEVDEEPAPAKMIFGDLREYQSKNMVKVFGDDAEHSPDATAPISAGVDAGLDDVTEVVNELGHLANVLNERIETIRKAKKVSAIELFDLYLLGDDVRSAASDAVNNFKDVSEKIGNTRSVRAARTRRSW